jgi:hypothetical protein
MHILLLVAALGVGHPDPAIARALTLLGQDAPTASIVVVTPKRLRVQGPQAEWAARTDGKTIEIANDSRQYRRALKKGDAIALAAQIAHEAWHIAHGFAEPPAYAEQLRVLRALGAKHSEIEAVEYSLYQVQP